MSERLRVAAIGFCLGRRVGFLANTLLPVIPAISYYAVLTEQYAGRADRLQGPHLFFSGRLDKQNTTDHINTVMDALKHTGKAYTDVWISMLTMELSTPIERGVLAAEQRFISQKVYIRFYYY